MTKPEIVRAHVFVSGYVQGVFYRSNCAEQARALDLKGWVRNLPDGRVEAVFQGPKDAVDKAIQWCKNGPTYARVKDVKVTREESKDDLDDFHVSY